MSNFLKNFISSFFVKTLIVVTGMLGVGPENLISMITILPEWFYKVSQSVFLVLLGMLLIYGYQRYSSQLISKAKDRLDRAFGRIEWIDGPHSIHTFGYTISRTHDLLLVSHIGLKGISHSRSPLRIKKAYMRSLVTSEIVKIKINGNQAENLEISPNVLFNLTAIFMNEDGFLAGDQIEGISTDSFIKRFSNFEVIIQTDQKNYRIEFDSEETRSWVTQVLGGLMMPSSGEKSAVLSVPE